MDDSDNELTGEGLEVEEGRNVQKSVPRPSPIPFKTRRGLDENVTTQDLTIPTKQKKILLRLDDFHSGTSIIPTVTGCHTSAVLGEPFNLHYHVPN